VYLSQISGRFALIGAIALPFATAGCDTSSGSGRHPAGAGGSSSAGAPGGANGNFAGGCDIDALFAKPENGCTNTNCHGKQFQGDLDLASPGLARRVVGVKSSSDVCTGQLLVDPVAPDASLLLRLVDAKRFAAAPDRCGVLMPLGSSEGLAADDLACVENWVRGVAGSSTDSVTPAQPFEPVAAESYVSKVKTLLTGGAVSAEELDQVTQDPTALAALVAGWTETPEFQLKMADFFGVALQQRLVGTLNFQLNTVQGPHRAQLSQNAEDSFVRTTWDIVSSRQPFTQVLTTHRFALTTGLLVGLAYADTTVEQQRKLKHTVYRTPPAGAPDGPWTQAYSLENKAWLLPALPEGCDAIALNGANLLDMLMGFVRCPQPTGNTSVTSGTVLSDADYADWRLVEIRPATAAHPATPFYDVEGLRGQTVVYLNQPRVGFFTTPAFFGNWDTNDGNQFRVTTSQTVITALGQAFSPADATTPISLAGLDAAHAPPGSTCYGCHQFLDPMRGYFSSAYSINYQGTATPSTDVPAFSFRGTTQPGGDLDTLASTLAQHPLFATAWTQKLCYWANSQACDETDPEFVRIARAFADGGFDFIGLVQALMASPLVTGATETATYDGEDYLVSITRRAHFCQMLDSRLGLTDACGQVSNAIGLIPEDAFSRGTPVPVQPAVSSLFHFAAAEATCKALAKKLVATGQTFDPSSPDTAISDMVSKLMGLSTSHSRAAAIHQQLSEHFSAARAAGATQQNALRDTFTLACLSPDVMTLGL